MPGLSTLGDPSGVPTLTKLSTVTVVFWVTYISLMEDSCVFGGV